MINTDKTFNNQAISYEILTDGYKIYLGGNNWIEQTEQYSKPMDKTKTYEENCLMQIEDLCQPTLAEGEISDSEALSIITGGEQ